MAKKNSATKKLVAAAAMLGVSTTMLSGATYAWFTMSREVEVQNIQMTATVPEDLQISIGTIGTDNSTASTAAATSLATNGGFLVASGDTVTAPRESGQYQAIDWSNTVDISHYYTFGRLIPASSDTGASIFFTPDANGIGQTVKTDAKYYIAASGTTITADTTLSGTGSSLMATAHVNTGSEWGSGTGVRATAWNTTNDDGYFIDIPVWLRTSSPNGATVSAKAYVVDKNAITGFGTDTSGTTTDKELYRAVRVAILTDAGAAVQTKNLIPVKDGDNVLASGTGTGYLGASILDWYGTSSTSGTNPSKSWGGAVKAVAEQGSTTPTYNSSPQAYDGTSAVATLAAGEGNVYGAATKVIVRIWLEGEDPDCYNETAGQDWSINLMFEKIDN